MPSHPKGSLGRLRSTYGILDCVQLKVEEVFEFVGVFLSLSKNRCVFSWLQLPALLLCQVFTWREDFFDFADAQACGLQLVSPACLAFQNFTLALLVVFVILVGVIGHGVLLFITGSSFPLIFLATCYVLVRVIIEPSSVRAVLFRQSGCEV